MGVINLGLLVDKIKRKLENAGFIKNTDYASASAAGVVKVGDGLEITEAGVLSAIAQGGGGVEVTEIWDGTGTVGYTFPTGKTITDYNFLVIVGGDNDVSRITAIVPVAIIPESGNIMIHMLFYDASPAVLKMVVGRTTISKYAGSSSGLNPKKLYVF